MRSRGYWPALVSLVLAMAALPTGALAASPVAETRHASGIALVGPTPIQVAPKNATQGMAFDAALKIAQKNRTHMGYPWIDPSTGTLEISVAGAKGQSAALGAQNDKAIAALPSRVKTAAASIDQLDKIGDAVTRLLGNGVPNADLIWMTEPDQKNNRIVITMSSLDDKLMSALAAQFGTDLIAVRIRARPNTSSASRNSDAPPFWGGAKYSTATTVCSTGFPWDVGSGVSGMLTAAHCASTGGSISYPAYSNVGSVRSASEENWKLNDGTQHYTGQTVDRGDVALIRYTSSYSSKGYIYMGPPGSNTSAKVAGMDSRWAQFFDAVCVGGITTGEWCGAVTDTGVNIYYVTDGAWVRHIDVAGAAGNTCPTHGDSGAPVYQKRSDGRVTAFGILSGSAPIILYCEVYFTDIWDAYYGLPGVLKTTP